MFPTGEGTEDWSTDDDNDHDDNGDGYGGGGGLSASETGKADGAERRYGRRVHVQTVVDIFFIPGLVPEGIKGVEGGGGGKIIEGGFSGTFPTGLRKINFTFIFFKNYMVFLVRAVFEDELW